MRQISFRFLYVWFDQFLNKVVNFEKWDFLKSFSSTVHAAIWDLIFRAPFFVWLKNCLLSFYCLFTRVLLDKIRLIFVLELIGRELPTPIVITTTMLMKNRLMGKCIRGGGVFTFWAFFMKKETFFPHGFIGIDQITTKVHHRVQVKKKLLSLCISITRSFWLGKI